MNQFSETGTEVELDLPKQVSAEIASDISKESVYVSPHLKRIVVSADGRKAILSLRTTEHATGVVDKATRFLAAMCKHIDGFDVTEVFRTCRRDDGPYETDVHTKFVERGWVHEFGPGRVAYSGPVLRLARLVNARAEALYREVFEFADVHFPAFVDHETLHKTGYIESHPTAVSLVANVIEDFDALEAYRLANSCGGDGSMPPIEHLHHGGMCLNPAACLPAYPTLAGKTVAAEGQVISWLGRVFRYESRNVSGLDRLYEFNVREIVFIGSERFVGERRHLALPLIRELAEMVDLDVVLQSATDPFFATVSAAKKFFQHANDVKGEILLNVLGPGGERRQLAGGSVNLHGPFFGERFGIRTREGDVAHTGCIGLGIERWVLAAFTQHGFDPARWPEDVRHAIFD